MRLYYATTKTYPATTADHIYIRELSKGFVLSGANFTLLVSRTGDDLINIPTEEILPRGSKTFSFLLWLISFCKKGQNKDVVFMANDFNILAILIVYRYIFRHSYMVVSDWHLMTGTWKDGLVARGSDVLITTSERLRSLISWKFPKTTIHSFVVYGGVDTSAFNALHNRSKTDIRKELNLPIDKKIIGYVGGWKTMGMDKGLGLVLSGLQYLEKDIICVFVGGSVDEITEYSAIAEKMSVKDRCVFIGRYDYSQAALYEKALDVLVIPYPNEPHFTDYGFPMKVYEYLASGTPVVYSNLEIIDEVMKGKGISFEAGNAGSFVRAVEKIITQKPEMVRDMEEYSWENKAREVEVLVQKKLGHELGR